MIAEPKEKPELKKMSFDIVMANIAQGVINIDEGFTEIQANSRIHNAMKQLCDLVSRGQLTPGEKYTWVQCATCADTIDITGTTTYWQNAAKPHEHHCDDCHNKEHQ